MSTGALVALTAVSAGMSIIQGVQTNSASTEAGIAYLRQAQIAQAENELEIAQKQREIDQTAAQQVMAMAKNGMDTGRGSPLEILQATAYYGQQEIDALKLSGQADVEYYTALANQQFNNGRTALLGGFADALTTIATAGIKYSSAKTSSTNTSSGSNYITSTVPSSSATSYLTGIENDYYGYSSGTA